MLTIFALPKPFRGHTGAIQHNALASWTRLRPRPEIILFADEEGTAQVAQEIGGRHVPTIQRSGQGTPLLNHLFEQGQALARYDTVCYVNADIVLLGDFMKAVERLSGWRDLFLMVGQRTNVDLDEPDKYRGPDQEALLRSLVLRQNQPRMPGAIDYFVFPRGLFPDIPPFAIGRGLWDNWLLWKARSSAVPVVDVSAVALAIHQNHDYSHVSPDGWKGLLSSEEAIRNGELAGSRRCALEDATHMLTPNGIKRNLRGPLFKMTRSLRHRLGIRRNTLTSLMSRIGIIKGQHDAEPGTSVK
jgi:hypothetical protein